MEHRKRLGAAAEPAAKRIGGMRARWQHLIARRQEAAAAEDAKFAAETESAEGAEDPNQSHVPTQPVAERLDSMVSGPPQPTPVAALESPLSERTVPPSLRVAASWSWRILLVAGLVYLLFRIVDFMGEVIFPVTVAILLAALLRPFSKRLRKLGLPRGIAAALILLAAVAVVLGALTLIVNSIVAQAAELGNEVADSLNQLRGALSQLPFTIDENWFKLAEWGVRIQQFLVESQTTVATFAGDIGTKVGHFFAGIAICLFSLFYFLYDGRGIFRFTVGLLPKIAQPHADRAAQQGWRSLSSFVRATVLVALADAVGVFIVAVVLQVPLAPALAALVFLGAFIPLVGAFVSGTVAVLVALVAVGWVQALLMLAGIILVVQIEGHILQPFLLGRAVQVHPLAVVLAIAAGIVIGGIVGALVAVPLVAFVKAFVKELYRNPGPGHLGSGGASPPGQDPLPLG